MTLYQGGYDVDRASRVAANSALDEACGRGGGGADDPAGAMPLTPEQLDHIAWLATSRLAIAIVEKPVLAALLAAYRREVRMHLDRALTKLHYADDCERIGHLYYELIGEAASEVEQAGHAKLAADLREGEPVRRVTDAVRELLLSGREVMASMRVSLPGLFANVVLELPKRKRAKYQFALTEVLKHLRETIAGEHTLGEFADHYCLKDELSDAVREALRIGEGEK